jgi:hypothetical protein
MNISPKQVAALELLAQTGMRRSNYEPPMLRLLWRLGIDMPPPHFAGVVRNLIFFGVPPGIGAGLGNVIANVILNKSGAVLFTACFTSLFCGLIAASYYAYGARKHCIPRWKTFSGSYGI